MGLGKGDVELQAVIPSHQAEPWRIYTSWKDELDYDMYMYLKNDYLTLYKSVGLLAK